MTSQEPYTQHLADPDLPDTEVILVEQPAPVFVDSTGRRRRLLRRFSYAFGAFCMVYGGLISLSLAGGPVSPHAVLPFPDLIDGGRAVAADTRPSPAPAPPVSAPRAVLVNEDLPRRAATPRHDGVAGTRGTRPSRPRTPSAGSSPRPSASATPTRTHPVESTTTKPTTSAPSTSRPASPTTPATPPTGMDGGSGGTGGGGPIGGRGGDTDATSDETGGGAADPDPGSGPGGQSGSDAGGEVAGGGTAAGGGAAAEGRDDAFQAGVPDPVDVAGSAGSGVEDAP